MPEVWFIKSFGTREGKPLGQHHCVAVPTFYTHWEEAPMFRFKPLDSGLEHAKWCAAIGKQRNVLLATVLPEE